MIIDPKEASRLENLWAGEFGDAYTLRNQPNSRRAIFWKKTLSETKPKNILEVGCNQGGNLRWISQMMPPKNVYGVDINESALGVLKKDFPGVNALWSQARELPFRDGYFEAVFTAGVLIHQPTATLRRVMGEIVRCSKRHVFCLEYFSQTNEEILYRGHKGALFKRDYGQLYLKWFPNLRLRKTGFLGKDQGWDDVTFWLFEKKGK